MATRIQLLQMAKKLEWASLSAALPHLSDDEFWGFATELLAQSLLIYRRSTPPAERDQFVDLIASEARRRNQEGLFSMWGGVDGAKAQIGAIEVGYSTILEYLNSAVRSTLTGQAHAWSSLRLASAQFGEVLSAVTKSVESRSELADPVSFRVTLDDGSSISPDVAFTITAELVSSTLKMLGFLERWFNQDGALVLPPEVPAAGQPKLASRDQVLASAWRNLERSASHWGCFGGKVSLVPMSVQKREGGESVSLEVVEFDLEPAVQVPDRIAHERVKRMFFQYSRQLEQTNARAICCAGDQVPAIGNGHISFEEIHATICLSEAIGVAVQSIPDRIAGLTIPEWIRGYAVLKQYAESLLGRTPAVDPLFTVVLTDLRDVLLRHALSAGAADCFLKAITFGKNSAELLDCPLIRVADGSCRLCVIPAAMSDVPLVVLSQLEVAGVQFDWKGPPFEDKVIALFRENKVEATRFKGSLGGRVEEIDCVFVWDGILFVVECKNVFLSGPTEVGTLRHVQTMAAAVEQVERKAKAAESDPEPLRKSLGGVSWNEMQAFVLNALPYSVPTEEGAGIYDFSSLKRFFDDRYLRVISSAQVNENIGVESRHGVFALWKADVPCAADLINQIRTPIAWRFASPEYSWDPLLCPLSDSRLLRTSTLRRRQTTLESMAAAVGMDASVLRSELEKNHSTLQRARDYGRQILSRGETGGAADPDQARLGAIDNRDH